MNPPHDETPEQTPSSTAPAEPDAAIVRLIKLHKRFGSQRVLRSATMIFPEGKTTVVLGPSGVGKSVVLKHIVGLIKPDRGEVWFRDQRVDKAKPAQLNEIRAHIGFLFQQAALFDSMTVQENVLFPLREHARLTRAEQRDRVADALKTVGLDGMQQKLPTELSGGQKKRVGLARAIIRKPSLMLYDEPTTGLDPVRADGINELILQLRDELGVSGIVVTHDLASARKVADRLMMLYDGSVIAEGTFTEIAQSEDDRVRRFLSGHYDPREDTVAKQEWAPH